MGDPGRSSSSRFAIFRWRFGPGISAAVLARICATSRDIGHRRRGSRARLRSLQRKCIRAWRGRLPIGVPVAGPKAWRSSAATGISNGRGPHAPCARHCDGTGRRRKKRPAQAVRLQMSGKYVAIDIHQLAPVSSVGIGLAEVCFRKFYLAEGARAIRGGPKHVYVGLFLGCGHRSGSHPERIPGRPRARSRAEADSASPQK